MTDPSRTALHQAFTASLILFLAWASLPLASSESPSGALASSGGWEWRPRVAVTYLLNMSHVEQEVDETRSLNVTLTGGQRVRILFPLPVPQPPGRYVNITGTNRTVWEPPPPVQQPRRTVDGDPDSRVSLHFGRGLYGSITTGGHVWSLQPTRDQREAKPGTVIQEVVLVR